MPAEINILPAIRRLYDAATDAAKWPAFLEELADGFNAAGAHILRVHPSLRALSFSILTGTTTPSDSCMAVRVLTATQPLLDWMTTLFG